MGDLVSDKKDESANPKSTANFDRLKKRKLTLNHSCCMMLEAFLRCLGRPLGNLISESFTTFIAAFISLLGLILKHKMRISSLKRQKILKILGDLLFPWFVLNRQKQCIFREHLTIPLRVSFLIVFIIIKAEVFKLAAVPFATFT